MLQSHGGMATSAATDNRPREEAEEFLRRAEAEGELPRLREWLDRAEAWRITRALRDAGGNRSAAARALGIGRRTLYAKMEKLGIRPVWSSRDARG
jgi:DNA-binding NtrC family response regulator